MMKARVAMAVAVLAVLGGLGAGCQSAPRARPVKMGDVETGAGSLESVRRQLEGKWALVRYEVVGPDGQVAPLVGTGVLTYDAFGNVDLVARATSASGESLPITMQGRVVIDTAGQFFYLADVAGDAAGQRPLPGQIAADKRRYYTFDGDELRLEIRDAAGKTTARSAWRRTQ